MSLQEKFDRAAENVTYLKREPSVEEKKELYGLFKQATGAKFEDAPKVEKPRWFELDPKLHVAYGKYTAWEKYKDVPAEEAKKQYVELFEKLEEKYGLKPEEEREAKKKPEEKKEDQKADREEDWEDEN